MSTTTTTANEENKFIPISHDLADDVKSNHKQRYIALHHLYYVNSLDSSSLSDTKPRERSRSKSPSTIKQQHQYQPQPQQQQQPNQYQETMKTKINTMITEKNQNGIKKPSFDAPLVSLSLFNELQSSIISQDVLEKEYNDYKEEYEHRRCNSFYIEHENDEWFKEKYDPEIYVKWRNERNTQAKKLAQKFFEKYKDISQSLKLRLKEEDECNKSIKLVLYTCNAEGSDFEEKERDISKISIQSSNNGVNSGNSSTTFEIDDKPYYGFDPDKLTLFIHKLPRNISRWQILEEAKKVPGFLSLSLSEPIKNQNYYRYCWLSFENEEKCTMAYDILKDHSINSEYKMHPQNSQSNSTKKIRLTPPLFDERIVEDVKHTKKLITIFDKDKEIENNPLLETDCIDDNSNNSVNSVNMDGIENQLDLQLLYLRRVHGFCYYCLKEHEDERNLATKCDNAHLRNYKQLGSRTSVSFPQSTTQQELTDAFTFDKFFTEKVKSFFKKGVLTPPPKHISKERNDELKSLRDDYCMKMTSKVTPQIFKCQMCQKKFKGETYVHNHILNKHMNAIVDGVDKEYFENKKRENYLLDPYRTNEKLKVITLHEDYLNAISHGKKYSNGGNYGTYVYPSDSNGNKEGHGKEHKHQSGYDRMRRSEKDKKKKYGSDGYVDLDDPNRQNAVGGSDLNYDEL